MLNLNNVSKTPNYDNVKKIETLYPVVHEKML